MICIDRETGNQLEILFGGVLSGNVFSSVKLTSADAVKISSRSDVDAGKFLKHLASKIIKETK